MNTLKAEKRSMSDKAKKLRREGYVTGNVFGRSIAESIPVQIEKKEAEKFLSVCGKGSEAQLSLEGQQYDVLVKEVDYDPIKRQTLEIDFQVLTEGEKVRSVAEIVLVNHELVQGVLVLSKLFTHFVIGSRNILEYLSNHSNMISTLTLSIFINIKIIV